MGTIVYSILLFALLFHVDEVLGQATSGTPFATSQAGSFATPLTSNLIDNGALAEWMDGTERPLANPALLRQFIWTRTTQSAGGQFEFGSSNQPGPRHLRIGFTAPVAFESILVRGGGGVSVLRPGSPYPGNLIDETQWITAKRVVNGQPSNAEVDKGSYALWILPSGTRTRALRFTHISSLTDSNYSGVFGGIYLLADRFANLAPQAKVAVSANFSNARLLVDEQDNNWLAWDNGPEFRHPVSPSSPEWIILSWSQPVSIRGLATLWAGFNAASVQVLFGPEDLVPTTAPESAWRSVGADYNLRSQYPRALGVDWMDFGKTVVTRAIRVRLTQVTDESHHSHLIGKTKNGTRVWLGELMALAPMGAGELQPLAASARVSDAPHAPIPVQFSIASPGYVTLAIDDAKGDRIRNLVSDTWFEAGKNTVWWDGTDDLGRNPEAAQHGVYLIPTHFVAPGHYEVRGLFHKAIDLHYEFSVYSAGNPPWETADTKGGWLTNHTPPSSTLFLPADKAPGGKPLMYLGSYVSEGGAGLAWVDLEGNKQGGRGWIGGAWTAAPFLARDSGPSANADIYAYVGSAWYQDVNKDQKQPSIVIRLTGLTSHGDKAIPGYSFNPGDKLVSDITKRPNSTDQMGGLTIYNGLIAVSLSLQDQILFIEAASGRLLGKIPSNKPTGLVFDAQGRLLVLAGKQLLRYKISQDPADFQSGRLPAPQTLVGEGLEDPAGITTDSSGNIYISDRGKSSQVKIFSQSGAFLRSIGHAGLPQAGPYDALHMNNPRGMAIDSDNHLWVAEEDFQPKRVSLWTLDGKFVRAFYGPSEYGGGGTLDPQDKTKFYYHGMEFKLDWVSGRDSIASVLYRPEKDALLLPRFGEPGTVLYRNGHRYFTNCYMNYPTNGVSIGMLFLDRSGIIRPVAALGKASDWDVFKGPEFKALLPAGSDLSSRAAQDAVLFSWSDQNGDGKIDPEEVTFVKSTTGAITVMPDLSMIDALVNGQVIQYVPGKFSSEGTPAYDLKKGQVIGDGAQIPSSDGGGQVLYSPQATVMTTAPLPFSRDGVGGIDSSNHRWSYPSLWPGLHPAHSAPIPDHPGELVGTTRLLGGFINPPGTDTGPLWGINGNFGNMYLFTADGFFRTGDVGVFDSDGYLSIVGREKDLIISGGLNVYPKEIEEAIDALPGVAASAVIGVPDSDFGEAVVAVIVARPDVAIDSDAIRDSLRVVLAAYKVPKRIYVVAELPHNAMGKVEKARLRTTYS